MSTKLTGRIDTLPDLLAHALAMETEATERYGELADQMETHRKGGVAAIFRRLEAAEKQHLGELKEMCGKVELPHYAPWEYKWNTGESPEAIDIGKVSYRISVHEAVKLALEHEQRAIDFYTSVADTTADAAVRKLAQQFAEEEREHIGWLQQCLADAAAEDGSINDPDPPLSQE